MTNNTPKISVVMSCYNRKDYVSDAIESILNQTYKDFEFIIIDDCSTDGTKEIIQKYADNDSRIVYIKNPQNMDYNYNLRQGFNVAKGEYIARMDDDDISLPERFEKQVKYLDEHQDITVLGTFIETFGDEKIESWVFENNSEILDILLNFFNPMCHPSVMIRKSFLRQHNLNYSPEALYAEEYDLWKNISLKGGKLANLPEILVKYRVHKSSVTKKKKTGKIQAKTAKKVRTELLSRYFNSKDLKFILKRIKSYPFKYNKKKDLFNVLEKMKDSYKKQNLNVQPIIKTQDKYCGIPSQMEIFFASDDKFTQHLSVAMASILINSLPIETFNFYILDGGISEKNKKKILQLKSIKDFNIEFIKVDDTLFKDCKLTEECHHISRQTYYRFIIPKIKPNLEKCLYLDCDILAEESLNSLWNLDLKNNYCAAVEELYNGSYEDKRRLGLDDYFNAGVMLINNKLWSRENITDTLFYNAVLIQNKIRWVDQDVLNYTFNENTLFISPRFNLQQNAFFDGYSEKYTTQELELAKWFPIIVHYNGCDKPWNKHCKHLLWKNYYKYLKFTPFKMAYYKYLIKQLLKKIYYKEKNNKYKLIRICGIKFKSKLKKYPNNIIKTEINDTILEFHKKFILDSIYWDASWYLREYNSNLNKVEALNYWLLQGWKYNESPSKYFNVKYYTEKYKITDQNPLIHFLTKGKYYCYYPDNNNNFKSSKDIKIIENYLEYKKKRKAKGIVYTCITNNYDDINEIKTYSYVDRDWDYICFTDNEEHIAQKQIGIWEILPLQYTNSDATGNNRWHKMHPHRLFPEYEESIYVDANINILTDKIFQTITQSKNNILVPEHYSYNCIYFELKGSMKTHLHIKDKIEKELNFIKTQGMPKNYGFTENNILYRRHNDMEIINIMNEWWEIFNKFAPRDQFSFTYLLWKHNINIEDIIFQNTRLDNLNFYVFDHKKGIKNEGI